MCYSNNISIIMADKKHKHKNDITCSKRTEIINNCHD